MAELRGNLLIGGMTLKNLSGRLDEEAPAHGAHWGGELLIDPKQREFLEAGRPYRLELDDGRAGKVVITKFEGVAGQQQVHAIFEGLSSIEERQAASEWHEPVEAGR